MAYWWNWCIHPLHQFHQYVVIPPLCQHRRCGNNAGEIVKARQFIDTKQGNTRSLADRLAQGPALLFLREGHPNSLRPLRDVPLPHAAGPSPPLSRPPRCHAWIPARSPLDARAVSVRTGHPGRTTRAIRNNQSSSMDAAPVHAPRVVAPDAPERGLVR